MGRLLALPLNDNNLNGARDPIYGDLPTLPVRVLSVLLDASRIFQTLPNLPLDTSCSTRGRAGR